MPPVLSSCSLDLILNTHTSCRFPTVVDAAREASFVPESSPGLLGHMFATALAAVTIKPKGLVQGREASFRHSLYLVKLY